MAKFIINQKLLLQTTVEVEAENLEQFREKYDKGDYDDIISREQLEQWNVVDIFETVSEPKEE